MTEIFRHVHEGIARFVGHAVAIQAAQTQHAHEFFLRIGKARRRGCFGVFGWRRRRSWRRRGYALAPAVLQFRLDVAVHLFVAQPVFRAEAEQIFFRLRREHAVREGESEIFVKFRDGLLAGLRGQFIDPWRGDAPDRAIRRALRSDSATIHQAPAEAIARADCSADS